MTKWNLFFIGCMAVALSGCSSVTVSRDYDLSADFSNLSTYAWKHAEQPRTGNARIDNDLIDARVRAAIDAELAGKGFTLAKPSAADFQIAYFLEYKQRIGGSAVSFGIGTGTYSRFGGIGYDIGISDYDEGYLTIDVIDPADGEIIWRGVGRRASYDTGKPAKTTKIVNMAVARILAKFPPVK
ncbi:MAG: DUF4136 domain-containing protein [Pontiella sp.]|nr:DUF4136 domain-containing protein [Pontiella sp.]